MFTDLKHICRQIHKYASQRCTVWYIFTQYLYFINCNQMPCVSFQSRAVNTVLTSYTRMSISLVLTMSIDHTTCSLLCLTFLLKTYLWDSLTLLHVIIVSFHHCIVFTLVNILQFIYPFHWWIFGLFPVWPITNMYCWHLPFGEHVHVCVSYLFIYFSWVGSQLWHGGSSLWHAECLAMHRLLSACSVAAARSSRLVDAPP